MFGAQYAWTLSVQCGLPFPSPVSALAFDPREPLLWVGHRDGSVGSYILPGSYASAQDQYSLQQYSRVAGCSGKGPGSVLGSGNLSGSSGNLSSPSGNLTGPSLRPAGLAGVSKFVFCGPNHVVSVSEGRSSVPNSCLSCITRAGVPIDLFPQSVASSLASRVVMESICAGDPGDVGCDYFYLIGKSTNRVVTGVGVVPSLVSGSSSKGSACVLDIRGDSRISAYFDYILPTQDASAFVSESVSSAKYRCVVAGFSTGHVSLIDSRTSGQRTPSVKAHGGAVTCISCGDDYIFTTGLVESQSINQAQLSASSSFSSSPPSYDRSVKVFDLRRLDHHVGIVVPRGAASCAYCPVNYLTNPAMGLNSSDLSVLVFESDGHFHHGPYTENSARADGAFSGVCAASRFSASCLSLSKTCFAVADVRSVVNVFVKGTPEQHAPLIAGSIECRLTVPFVSENFFQAQVYSKDQLASSLAMGLASLPIYIPPIDPSTLAIDSLLNSSVGSSFEPPVPLEVSSTAKKGAGNFYTCSLPEGTSYGSMKSLATAQHVKANAKFAYGWTTQGAVRRLDRYGADALKLVSEESVNGNVTQATAGETVVVSSELGQPRQATERSSDLSVALAEGLTYREVFHNINRKLFDFRKFMECSYSEKFADWNIGLDNGSFHHSIINGVARFLLSTPGLGFQEQVLSHPRDCDISPCLTCEYRNLFDMLSRAGRDNKSLSLPCVSPARLVKAYERLLEFGPLFTVPPHMNPLRNPLADLVGFVKNSVGKVISATMERMRAEAAEKSSNSTDSTDSADIVSDRVKMLESPISLNQFTLESVEKELLALLPGQQVSSLIVHVPFANCQRALLGHLVCIVRSPRSDNTWRAFNDFSVTDFCDFSGFQKGSVIAVSVVDKGGIDRGSVSSLGSKSVLAGPLRISSDSDADTVARESLFWSDLESITDETIAILTRAELELVKQKKLFIAVDSEFVALSMTQGEFLEDGTRFVTQPAEMALARVSMLRAVPHNGSKSAPGIGPSKTGVEDRRDASSFSGDCNCVPFIDHYVETDESMVKDYVTRFSGVNKGDLTRGISTKRLAAEKKLIRIFQFLIDAGAVFIGHGLVSDFRVMNVYVPDNQIIDTSVLYYEPERGFVAMRHLAKKTLHRSIHGKEGGHDSVEDAETSYRLYIAFCETSHKRAG